MDKSMEDLLAQLPLSDEINNALLYHDGHIGHVLKCVIAYERGNWDELKGIDLQVPQLPDCYLEAIAWSNSISQEFN